MSEFPSRTEALAILYLQNQDLTGKSPSEINTIYWEAYYQIKNDYWEKNQTDISIKEMMKNTRKETRKSVQDK